MKRLAKRSVALLLGAGALGAALWVTAQEYPQFRGGPARDGLQVGSLTTYNPGRAFLRWWDPSAGATTTIDNWQTANGASATPATAWTGPLGTTEASLATEIDAQPGRAPYVMAFPGLSGSVDRYWEPASGTAAFFQWRFQTQPGQEYQLYVNVPVGPTEIIGGPAGDGLYFPQQYFVYEISGVENLDDPGQPVYQKVDTYLTGGGEVRLGNDGRPTDLTYRSTGTTLSIRLLALTTLDAQGVPTDTRPNRVVYADSAKAIRSAGGSGGSTFASPIVGTLKASGSDPYPSRVFAGRDEPGSYQVGGEVEDYSVGVLSAYRHNGLKIDSAEPGFGGDIRRNILWSWPSPRPRNETQTELDRYAQGKRDWVLGAGAPISRTFQTIHVDNQSSHVQAGLGFAVDIAIPGFRGVDAFTSDAQATATARVFYRPKLPTGAYSVDVWTPGGADLAKGALVEVFRGAFLLGSVAIDQSGSAGWRSIQLNNAARFEQDPAAPLTVVITNQNTQISTDPNKKVMADAVRFSRVADHRITSTPVFATIPVNVGGTVANRDVVIAATETGRIYALNAQGDVTNGSTNVLWSYPSERLEGSDPNLVAGEDGPNGIATMPTGFGISSALIERVEVSPGNFQWLLYIASKNGRVYCLETEGRGDGTVRRRWTWPDDYPSPVNNLDLGEITGSITFGLSASGANPAAPTIFVPTRTGRLYALDAVGIAGNKSTTVRWQFPDPAGAPLGPINMTPALAFGRLYFGAGPRFYAVNVNDPEGDQIGNEVWNSTGTGAPNPFVSFGTSSPVAVSAANIGGGMPDTVFAANNNGALYALNATDGSTIWATAEVGAGPSGSIGFSYMNTLRNDGSRDHLPVDTANPGRPVVVVPYASGRIIGFLARLGDVNRDSTGPVEQGRRAVWGFATLGNSGGFTFNSPAFGGFDSVNPPPAAPLDDDYSWIYVTDSRGYLYGFNDDPDLPDNSQTLTPGDPPLQEDVEFVPDETTEVLRQIQQQAKTRLALPSEVGALTQAFRGGTPITYAQVEQVVQGGANAAKITRTDYDFGETLYVVVYDLPEFDALSAQPVIYNIQIEFNVGSTSVQRRTLATFPVTGTTADRGRIAIAQIPIQPTGQNGLAPGAAFLRAFVSAQRTSGGVGNLSLLTANMRPGDRFRVANPLALSLRFNEPLAANRIGVTVDPRDPEVRLNGNQVEGVGFKNLLQPFSNDLESIELRQPSLVPHGQSAVSQILVYDRSALRLLRGQGVGMTNVRFRPNDLAWQLDGIDDNRVKPLDDSIYPNFEDDPRQRSLYSSLDYPDIRRDAFVVRKDQFANAQNPIFQGVTLEAPTMLDADITRYNSDAPTYNQFVPRTLRPTFFDMELAVPRFQPPNPDGYLGQQFVYIDPNNSINPVFNANSGFAFRTFASEARIQVDERLALTNRTMDLGEMPAGAGYDPTLQVNSPNFFTNPRFHSTSNPFHLDFGVENLGNVNLVNVRLAKAVDGFPENRRFFSETNSDGAFLDAVFRLHSDLDPNFTPGALNNRRVVQKARVGDGAPTRLRLTPVPRGNPNLNIGDTQITTKEDPRVAVSVPIGTPVGLYRQIFYVIEDDIATPNTGQAVLNGSGSNYEPFSQDPMTVQFTVRETRLTNRTTFRTAPMVDAFTVDPDQQFLWNNMEPTGVRDTNGNLVVAFSSDRRSGGSPAFVPDLKTQNDAGNLGPTYLYFTTLGGERPNAGGASTSGALVNDLDNWQNANPNQWFANQVAGYPSGDPTSLFGLTNGATIDPTSVRFGLPSFSSSGVGDPTVPFGNRSGDFTWLAFVGEGRRVDPSGDTSRESRIFLSRVSIGANGSVQPGTPIPLEFRGDAFDTRARFGRPSVVHSGQDGTVFFPTTAGGLTQLNWALFRGGQFISQGRSSVGSLRIGSAFESVSATSAAVRRTPVLNGRPGTVIQVAFTGKLRGRPSSDVYLLTLAADRAWPSAPRNSATGVLIPWQTQFLPLEYEPGSDIYWSLGADLLSRTQDLEGNYATATVDQATATSTEFIDIMRRNGNEFQSVLRLETRVYDPDARILTADSIFGGKAVIDLSNGSVKFTGGLVPTRTKLYFRSTPRYVRISQGSGENYRGASMIYDDRPSSERNFMGAPGYVFNGSELFDANATMTVDRLAVAYLRTSRDGQSLASPYVRSLRPGTPLSFRPRVNAAGFLTNFRVTGLRGNAYQVDPVLGILYTEAVDDGNSVAVIYDAVDDQGQFIGSITDRVSIGLVREGAETKMPMSQGFNESPPTLVLDGQGSAFATNQSGQFRPGLMWFLWTSTRRGNQDLFMMTAAPRFIPTPRSSGQ